MAQIFDIYFLEALLNGLLLGGLLALLSVGLNLVFGVVEVIWVCYAELIMASMYCIWWLHVQAHWPLWAAFPMGVASGAILGVLLHQFIIRPVLAAEPINQLLVTGGVLFFLQALATVLFGIDYRNVGIRMPSLPLGEMQFSAARLVTFVVAVTAIVGTWLVLKRTYLGTAIRAISQDRSVMPLMGVNPSRIYLLTSAVGGVLVGLAACVLVLQYDVHPAVGLTFGPLIFLICVLGGLGNLLGGMAASFLFAQFISLGGYFWQVEWGQVLAFVFFILVMFWRPQGLFTRTT
jgi:branched-chain amino acid transport system permease protein